MERELLPNRRQGLILEVVPRVLVGAAFRFAVRAFRHHALVARHHRLLRPGELALGEAELCDSLQLRQQRIEAATDAVGRDERLEIGFVLRPCDREQSTLRSRPEEGRVLPLAKLVEPLAEHAPEQLVEHQLAIPADRSLVARRSKLAHFDRGRRCLLVGDDRSTGFQGDRGRRTRDGAVPESAPPGWKNAP